jgi:hypothetical protein
MTQPTLFDTAFITPPERRNASLKAIIATGRIKTNVQKIRDFLANNPLSTAREIKHGTGLDINIVSGRLNEMAKRKEITTHDEKYDHETQAYVTAYRVIEP